MPECFQGEAQEGVMGGEAEEAEEARAVEVAQREEITIKIREQTRAYC